jgi:Zn-dependent protease with chaperone function
MSATVDEGVLTRWTAEERESFFAAIERHRRAAVRIRWVSDACAFVLAFVVALFMAPLLYGLTGLILDVINLLVPMPDLIGTAMNTMNVVMDTPEQLSAGRWMYLAVVTAAPGLLVMAMIMLALGRVLREAMHSQAGNFAVRAPDPTQLQEQRFANVVSEMSIAAGVPPPQIMVIESEAANAAAFGDDRSHASVAISTGLLHALNRAQLQGIAAHLVGSIANGDVDVGARVATTLSLFGLIARLSESFGDPSAAKRLMKLLRGALRRGASAQDGELALALTNPFESTATKHDVPEVAQPEGKIPWRTLMWMPIVGPLVISGFFGGMLSTFLLSPLLAWIWRRRKFLADATAVRLTRDPNTLAEGLLKLNELSLEGAFAPWTAHMSVVNVEKIGGKGLFRSAGAKMFPSLALRVQALSRLGASVSVPLERSAWAQMPLIARLILIPVGMLVLSLFFAVIAGLAYVSVALSGLFTWLPALLLHALIR